MQSGSSTIRREMMEDLEDRRVEWYTAYNTTMRIRKPISIVIRNRNRNRPRQLEGYPPSPKSLLTSNETSTATFDVLQWCVLLLPRT